jgi:hypothetical protein
MGLGLALGPATAHALESVPHELSNKAATLLTFFRQVGGTYGGTLIAILVIKRTIFHATRFSEQSNSNLPGFQNTYLKLYSHYHSTFFDDGATSATLAKATLVQNLEVQAYIQSINDAMMVFGYVTGAVALLLIGLSLMHKHNQKLVAKGCQSSEN